MERRRLNRRHLIYYLRVFDTESFSQEAVGHVVDISTEGMLLISEQELIIDRVYNMKMYLPTEIKESRIIELTCHTVWSKTDVNPDFFNTGCQFVEIDPDDVARIEQMIEIFGR